MPKEGGTCPPCKKGVLRQIDPKSPKYSKYLWCDSCHVQVTEINIVATKTNSTAAAATDHTSPTGLPSADAMNRIFDHIFKWSNAETNKLRTKYQNKVYTCKEAEMFETIKQLSIEDTKAKIAEYEEQAKVALERNDQNAVFLHRTKEEFYKRALEVQSSNTLAGKVEDDEEEAGD